MTIPALASTPEVARVSRPKITLAMIMCGLVSAACIGAAGAATPDDEALSVAVKYDADSISTDAGARHLYHKLVTAAEQVCPVQSSFFHGMPSPAVRECRQQSVARAVFKINNPRLVAVYNTASRNG